MADETQQTVDNVIYVGNNPPMMYMGALLMKKERGMDEIMIKARGRSISRAVDLLEISKNGGMLSDFDISIATSTEPYKFMKDGKERQISVSSIMITLKRKK
jgi:DNA-binding protein